jgi:hypothetical protein
VYNLSEGVLSPRIVLPTERIESLRRSRWNRTRPVVALLVMALFGLLLWASPAHAASATAVCVGDCNTSYIVTIDEVITMVDLALNDSGVAACTTGDADGNGQISIDEIMTAVHNALSGCFSAPPAEEPCPERNPLRNVYFGDLHVHTRNSFDAYLWDTRTTPTQAYEFARGQPLSLPPLDADGNGTRTVRLERPLDFTAVTDHSEFLGEVDVCTTPGSPSYDSANCELFRSGTTRAFTNFGVKVTASRPARFRDVCGDDYSICLNAAGDVWEHIQAAAAAAYQHCTFTSFVAWEYSRSPGGSTLHRNVIFRNDRVPFPISAFEEPTPQGLWRDLKATCLDAGTGCDVLAIPHNSNESNGHMFFVEYPGAQTIDEQRAQAAFRNAMEPLVEIYQHKGNSECFNGLSGIVGAPDEQCEFEKRRQGKVPDCHDGTGQQGAAGVGCVSRLDFVRGALLAGLQEQDRIGVNPYRLGFVGSTDTHNGTPGFTDEWSWGGHQGKNDAAPAALLGGGGVVDGGILFSPGALVGVWAEENSRSSIFDALRRKETFATSGTRLSARVFGGWDLPSGLCADPNLTQIGYDRGVPMGGVLAPRPAAATAPTFVVSALRDPGTAAHPGGQLQRVQVIKGWIEDGAPHQQVYDVAGDANNGASVDLSTCTPTGAGADSLCAEWTDPDFKPGDQAFYYARVLENPACRWNTWVCNRLQPADQPPACQDAAVPKTIQERAWTSPIWYQPQT